MATRFRLTQSTTAPAVSPVLQIYTHNAPATVRRKLLTSDSSALTNTAYTPDAADHGAAGDALWCQFVSDSMAAGKVFNNGDTISVAMQGFEAHANNNLNLQLYVSIVDTAGTTVQRELRSKVEHATELSTSLASRLLSTTQDGANYTTVAGDRLVVELSVEGTPGGGGGVQGHNGTMRFGGDGAGGDITADGETGTTLNPWFEVTPNNLFGEEVTPTTLALTTATFAPTVTVSDNKIVTPTTTALTTATFAPTVTVSGGGVTVTPDTVALTTATFAPTVSVSDNQVVTPTTAALSLSTFAPTASAPRLVTPTTATLTTATFAPTVTATANQTATPTTAALALSTFAPTVTGGQGLTVTPPTATLTLATFAPSVSAPRLVTPGTASLALSTFAPNALTPRLVTPGTTALALSTFAPTVSATAHQTVVPTTAALVLATFAPTVTGGGLVTGGGTYTALSARDTSRRVLAGRDRSWVRLMRRDRSYMQLVARDYSLEAIA